MSLTVGLMGTSSYNLGDYSIEVFLDKNQWIRVVDSKKLCIFLESQFENFDKIINFARLTLLKYNINTKFLNNLLLR